MIRQTRPPAGSQPVAVARVVLVFDRDARTTSTDLCLLVVDFAVLRVSSFLSSLIRRRSVALLLDTPSSIV